MGRKMNSFGFRSSKKKCMCVCVCMFRFTDGFTPASGLMERLVGMLPGAGVTQTLSAWGFIGRKRIDIFSTTPGTSCPAEPTIDLCVGVSTDY